MRSQNTQKPFSGMSVYDATQGVAGPHATMLLALHGADVIKVEPLEGDWGRVLGDTREENCIHSLAFNRGKRSIALDAKSEGGAEIARRIASKCNVFVESFRPGAAERLGLSYRHVRRVNPKVVYCSVSGFGQGGPYANRPTVDVLIQAFSGMMVMNRTADGLPHRQAMVMIDVLAGLYGFQAISAALMRQVRFDEGTYIDANLMQAGAAFQAAKIMEYHQTNGNPVPLYMPAGMFTTADGFIVISGMRSKHFLALCNALERPDMADAPEWATQELRSKNSAPMLAELRKEFPKRTTDEWLQRLHKVGVMAERVRSYSEWMEDSHVEAVGAFDWVNYPGFGSLPVANIPGVAPIRDCPESAHVPLIGEHTVPILRELDFSEDEIRSLSDSGAVRSHGTEVVRSDGC